MAAAVVAEMLDQCYCSYGLSVTVTVTSFFSTVTISVTNNQQKNIFGTHNNIFSAKSNIFLQVTAH